MPPPKFYKKNKKKSSEHQEGTLHLQPHASKRVSTSLAVFNLTSLSSRSKKKSVRDQALPNLNLLFLNELKHRR